MSLGSMYVCEGTWQNRVYFGIEGMSAKEICKANSNKDGVLQRGTGMRSYGNIWGAILAWFGFAVQLRIGKQYIYVNTNSYTQWKLRNFHVVDININARAEKVNNLYKTAKEKGYLSLPFILQKGELSQPHFLPRSLNTLALQSALDTLSPKDLHKIHDMWTLDEEAALSSLRSILHPHLSADDIKTHEFNFRRAKTLNTAIPADKKEAAVRYFEDAISSVIEGEEKTAAVEQLEQLFSTVLNEDQIKQGKCEYEQILTDLKKAAQKDYRHNGYVVLEG